MNINREVTTSYPASFPSVLVPANVSRALDVSEPMSFAIWAQVSDIDGSSKDIINRYQKYLSEWANLKTVDKETVVNIKKEAYKKLLSEVFVEFTTAAERKILSKLDYNDPTQADIAVPFLVKKLTAMADFYKRKRHTLRYTPTQVDFSGSAFGIEKTVFHVIVEHIRKNEGDFKGVLETLKKNISIEIVEFFDFYSNYFDVEVSEDTLTSEILALKKDPNLFLDFDIPLVDLIREYPLILVPYSSPQIDVSTGYSEAGDTERLENRDYADTNSGDTVLELKKIFISKFLGADTYFLTKDAEGTVAMGILTKAEKRPQNLLNISNPTVAMSSSTAELKTRKEVGMFTPATQGIIFYRPADHTFIVDNNKIEVGKTYVFPDPNLYGSVVGVSGNSPIDVPIIHHLNDARLIRQVEENLYVSGKIKNESIDVLTFAYVSKQQKNYKPLKDISDNIGPLQEIENSAITDYQEDIFGNRYFRYETATSYATDKMLAGLLTKTQHNNDLASQLIIFNRGTFMDEDGIGPYDYTIYSRVDSGNTIFERMGWGEALANTFDNFAPELFIKFGSFGDGTDSVGDSILVSIYDCGIIDLTSSTYLVLDPNFPYPSINYPFDTVLNGSIYSYLGDGNYIPVDTDHPSLFAEQLPEGYGLLILDGGNISEEETTEELEAGFFFYITDPDVSGSTLMTETIYPEPEEKNIFDSRGDSDNLDYYTVLSDGTKVKTSDFIEPVLAKYDLEDSALQKISIAHDIMVMNVFSASAVYIEKISFKDGRIYGKILRDNKLEYTAVKAVSNPCFLKTKHAVYIAETQVVDGIFDVKIHKFDGDLDEMSTFYQSPDSEDFIINSVSDLPEDTFNLDTASIVPALLTINEAVGEMLVIQQLKDIYGNPAILVVTINMIGNTATLKSTALNLGNSEVNVSDFYSNV